MTIVTCPRCDGSGIESDMTATDGQGCFDSKECEICYGLGKTDELGEFREAWHQFKLVMLETIESDLKKLKTLLNKCLRRK